jgi:hypothetical protein
LRKNNDFVCFCLMSVEESVDQAPISTTSEQQWQKVTPEKVLSNFQRKIDDTSLTNRRKHLKRLVELLAHDGELKFDQFFLFSLFHCLIELIYV